MVMFVIFNEDRFRMVVYPSSEMVANALGISVDELMNALNRGITDFGNASVYKDSVPNGVLDLVYEW